MMLAAYDLESFQHDETIAWKSIEVATVNGNAVRYRTMQDMTASWHVHDDSDELFYVISGTVHMDTEQGVHEIPAGHLFVVRAGTRHRARVEGRASMLVVDCIG